MPSCVRPQAQRRAPAAALAAAARRPRPGPSLNAQLRLLGSEPWTPAYALLCVRLRLGVTVGLARRVAAVSRRS
jgi:hypothetical protein